MPIVLPTDCPHCATKKAMFSYVGHADHPNSTKFSAAFTCAVCGELVCISESNPAGHADSSFLKTAAGTLEAYFKKYGRSVSGRTYPSPAPSQAPRFVPEAAERAFLQGLDNARRKQPDAAASMFRKALDVATRQLDASLAGRNLAPRIDALHAAGKLTEDLKDWAHLIRLDGNQGAHDDDELSDEEIEQLQSFTRLFLTYAFTLPAQVKERKEAAARLEGGNATPGD